MMVTGAVGLNGRDRVQRILDRHLYGAGLAHIRRDLLQQNIESRMGI